jgi:hypothetical protein
MRGRGIESIATRLRIHHRRIIGSSFRSRIAECPTRSPLSQEIDEPLEFAPGRRQSVFGPLASRKHAAFQDAATLQPPEPFRKQRAGHVGKTALKLVEMINVGKKFADDEHRPAVGENFRRPGHRTVLSIAVHGVSVAGAGTER